MQINLSRRNLIEFDSSAFTTDDDQEVLRSIKDLNISFNNISTLKGLHRLSTLTTVDVSHNSITSLRGLPLPLRKLNASFNVLSDLDGLFTLLHLEILVVSHNQITSLRGLPAKLRMIDSSSNQITSIIGIEKCNGLEELDISQNMIRTAEGLESLKSLHALKSLTIGENPVTKSRRHISAVFSLLPDSLEVIDLPSLTRTMQSSEVSSQSNITHDISSPALSLNNTSLKDAINLSGLSSTSTGKVSHDTSMYGCQSKVSSHLHHISPKGNGSNEEEMENLVNKKLVSSSDGIEKSTEEPHSSVPRIKVPLHSSAGTPSTVSISQDTSLTQQHPRIERIERIEKRQEKKVMTEVNVSFSEISTKRVTESMVEQLQSELDECRRVCAFYKKENAELRQRIQDLESSNKQETKSKVEILDGNLCLQFPGASDSSSIKKSILPDNLKGERNHQTHGNFSINTKEEKVKKPSNETSLNYKEKILQNNPHSLQHKTQELPGELLSLDEKAELRRGARSLASLFMSLVPVSTNNLGPLGSVSTGDVNNGNHHMHTSPSRGSGTNYNHNNGGPYSSERQEQEQNTEAGRRKRTVSFGGFAYYSPPSWQT